MAALLAESFGVSSSNSDNTNQILAAISAAANENTQVIFPAGDLKFSQDLVLPKGFVGCLSIAGLGKKITDLFRLQIVMDLILIYPQDLRQIIL